MPCKAGDFQHDGSGMHTTMVEYKEIDEKKERIKESKFEMERQRQRWVSDKREEERTNKKR